MNCKPGDLAVIVHDDFPENIGKFVTVLQRADPNIYSYPTPGGEAEPEWEVEVASRIRAWDEEFGQSSYAGPGAHVGMPDSGLRPIRDQPGEDETLTWAGKPHEVAA